MNKKILVATLAAVASLLVATNAVAATSIYCTAGVSLKFVGVGSSAQTNGLAYAASNVLKATSATANSWALVSFGGSSITDGRAAKSDTGLTTWVAYDPSATGPCAAYVFFQSDSGVGIKDFFAYSKVTSTSTVTGKQHFTSIGAASATLPALPIALGNKIGGLLDQCIIAGSACPSGNDPNGVPSAIAAALNQTPTQYLNSNGAGAPPAAPAYCGNVSTVAITAQFYCYFNAAATDIRPEDALYATTRGLAAYSGIIPPATHGGTLAGLGYGVASSKGCTPTSALIGCTIVDTFATNSAFNVLKFSLSGVDPLGSGTVPTYTTLSVGAAPVVVIAGNEDTSNFGKTVTDGAGKTNYLYNDINRATLAQVFSGYAGCLGDLSLSGTGSTIPLQVIEREPLSGTYNTFEFTGVRTYSGGPLLSTATPNANADSGQEQFNDPNVFPGHGGATDCTYTGTFPSFPTANCFNPLFLSYDGSDILVGKNCQGSTGVAPGLPARMRAIGTGDEVKAVIGTYNGSGLSTNVYNPIGYAFWSYGNLDPLCSSISGDTCTGTWKGHYLSVDAIDPLFATDGGEFDHTPNPSGAFNPPVCDLTQSNPNCFAIPFTHIYDGKYPLWTLLRTVTFAPVAGKHITPIGVLDIIANEEQTSVSDGLSDFVPFLNSVTGSNGVYTGNLNLFVFRSHFKQTGGTVAPSNGHTACAGNFTGVSLQGGAHGVATCLVDTGSDVGGVVLPVYKDVSFIADFGVEEYGLRQ